MKIHIITDRFSLGGGAEHIYQLVRHLPGISFRVVGREGPLCSRFEGLNHVVLHRAAYGRSLLKHEPPDILHFHHLRPLARFLALPGDGHLPLLYTLHGLHGRKYKWKTGFSSRLRFRARQNLEKWIFRHLTRLITVSRADRETLIQEYGLAADRITCIPNGMPRRTVPDPGQVRERMRRSLGVSKGTRCFLTAARFDFQKGYDILLRGILYLKRMEGDTQVRFLLAGDGSEMPAMRRLARKLDVVDRVRFLGARKDVPDLLRAADFFLLPSRWEGLPLGILEAGHSGCPVIASDAPGNRELLENGRGVMFKNGNWEDLAVKMKEILHTPPAEIRDRAQRMHRHLEKFHNVEGMARAVGDLYREVVSRG